MKYSSNKEVVIMNELLFREAIIIKRVMSLVRDIDKSRTTVKSRESRTYYGSTIWRGEMDGAGGGGEEKHALRH